MYSRLSRILAFSTLVLLGGCNDSRLLILNPKGPIGLHEKSIILTATWLMLIVVIPVIVMAMVFVLHYRASNKKATYKPNWDHSWKIELVVWLVPIIIVTALGILAWTSTHRLSPYRPLVSKVKPIHVDVVALDWKWLFIYPQQHIATVNQLVFPAHTPVDFDITSATVMASFFIPQLGGQIYAMAGLRTELHLLANEPGTYVGFNTQFSGRGYSYMHFKAVATATKSDFQNWVKKVKQGQHTLDMASFRILHKPTVNNPVAYYSSVTSHLFANIMQQYRAPKKTTDLKKQIPGVS